jgi:hypothetical protein
MQYIEKSNLADSLHDMWQNMVLLGGRYRDQLDLEEHSDFLDLRCSLSSFIEKMRRNKTSS